MGKSWAILAVVILTTAPAIAANRPATQPFETSAFATPQTGIDDLVFANLRRRGMTPANPCSDAVFLRRAYLAVIGTLPTAREARAFLDDADPRKRQKLIDQLLNRPEYADYWTMKWGDLLRVKAEFPIVLWPEAAQTYNHWIWQSIRDDKPIDQFARQLLTASGSDFRSPPANFYRAVQGRTPSGIAKAVALTFMGMRADKWPPAQLNGLAGFFTQVGYKSTGEWKEQIVYFDRARAATQPSRAVFPDGTAIEIPSDRDPRQVFANWLLSPRNKFFAQAMANRAWFWLMGRGIVQEPDDFRPDNPPSNPRLLAYLANQLVADHYDMKQLLRLILDSRTFQLSPIAADPKADVAAQFAYYPMHRLGAEVFIDAICQVTDSTEDYSTQTPAPYTFIPTGTPAIALADGSISSPFLDMFGRPPRDTGLASERNDAVTPEQRLYLLNSNHIRQKLERCRWLRLLAREKGLSPAAIDQVYLTILSRHPTSREVDVARKYLRSGVARGRQALIDLAWALINSSEFAYQH